VIGRGIREEENKMEVIECKRRRAQGYKNN
jgi:hypothetical protein